MRGRAGLKVAIVALVSAAAAGSVLRLVFHLLGAAPGKPIWWWLSIGAASLAGALAAASVVRRSFGGRLAKMAALIDERKERSDYLERLPDMGDDDVGRIAAALNRLLARITTLQVHVIDRDRELAAKQRELALAEELAHKQRELGQRLRERELLFDVLRESASSHDLDRVLRVLVERVGAAMSLREIAVLLREPSGRYVIRSVWGWDAPEELIGRAIGPFPEALAVEGRLILVPDVTRAPSYLVFWDGVAAEGSFAAVPIVHGREAIGLIAVTRPPEEPLGELDGRYLQAVADQAALAIHDAQLVQRLEQLSTHDPLTGLANRRLFDERLRREIAQAERYQSALSVLALDIDHFKQLNDRCGHAAGDAALIAVASGLRECLREADTLARVGGEELCVLLPHTDEEGASEVAEKLRRRVAGLAVEGAREQPLGHLSVSIGIARHRPGEDAASVLRRADDALYAAKRSGRDRVSWVA
ncbi:MAG: diguanylate cyclase [Sandaracinaceae bacterium]|nr:diguanylate cyclase [Sandaracinaceae bacterium]